MDRNTKHYHQLAEDIFDTIFEDYVKHDSEYLDFQDYRKCNYKRMQAIVQKHSRRIITLALEHHYLSVETKQ